MKSVYITEDNLVKGANNSIPEYDSSGLIPADKLGTGTGITTKYLRGDQTWQTVSGGSGTLVETHIPLIQLATALTI